MYDSRYPLEIIPQQDYKVDGFAISDILPAYPDIYISRRIDDDVNNFIDNDEGRPHLDTDCFGENYVHLSVNLMNSIFRKEHIKYSARGEAGHYWKGDPVSLEDYIAHVESNMDSTAVFYKVGDIHYRKFSKTLTLGKDRYNAMKNFLGGKALEAFSGKGKDATQDAVFDGFVCIDHCPVILNYWHCQVEPYPKDLEDSERRDDKKLLKNANSWRDEIFIHLLTGILCYDFHTDAVSDYEIDKKYYIG